MISYTIEAVIVPEYNECCNVNVMYFLAADRLCRRILTNLDGSLL